MHKIQQMFVVLRNFENFILVFARSNTNNNCSFLAASADTSTTIAHKILLRTRLSKLSGSVKTGICICSSKMSCTKLFTKLRVCLIEVILSQVSQIVEYNDVIRDALGWSAAMAILADSARGMVKLNIPS